MDAKSWAKWVEKFSSIVAAGRVAKAQWMLLDALDNNDKDMDRLMQAVHERAEYKALVDQPDYNGRIE